MAARSGWSCCCQYSLLQRPYRYSSSGSPPCRPHAAGLFCRLMRETSEAWYRSTSSRGCWGESGQLLLLLLPPPPGPPVAPPPPSLQKSTSASSHIRLTASRKGWYSQARRMPELPYWSTHGKHTSGSCATWCAWTPHKEALSKRKFGVLARRCRSGQCGQEEVQSQLKRAKGTDSNSSPLFKSSPSNC